MRHVLRIRNSRNYCGKSHNKEDTMKSSFVVFFFDDNSFYLCPHVGRKLFSQVDLYGKIMGGGLNYENEFRLIIVSLDQGKRFFHYTY